MPKIFTSDAVFELGLNESLLDGLERTGHAVEYQCKSGYCGACRLVIQSGTVTYGETPMAFIQSNEILPCCCRVLEDVRVVCQLREYPIKSVN